MIRQRSQHNSVLTQEHENTDESEFGKDMAKNESKQLRMVVHCCRCSAPNLHGMLIEVQKFGLPYLNGPPLFTSHLFLYSSVLPHLRVIYHHFQRFTINDSSFSDATFLLLDGVIGAWIWCYTSHLLVKKLAKESYE
ncbi:hypothetical protein L1887_16913 [Cichorium endivia]|nr:hypothetical protein L1887_16913 [Cichorium endivia]